MAFVLALALALVPTPASLAVTNVITAEFLVLPGTTLPETVLTGSGTALKLVIATTVVTVAPLYVVVIVVGYRIVSVTVLGGRIVGGSVEGPIVVPGMVVVSVRVTSTPREETGTAEPMPDDVY